MNRASGGSLTRVVFRGAVWLFTDKAKAVSEAAASFYWAEVQGVDIHGVWIMSWACGLRMLGDVGVCVLWSWSLVHQGNLPGNLPLEMEVGSFLVPTGDSGGDVVHSLNSLHDSDGDSGREIGDEGSSVFDFVVLSVNDI